MLGQWVDITGSARECRIPSAWRTLEGKRCAPTPIKLFQVLPCHADHQLFLVYLSSTFKCGISKGTCILAFLDPGYQVLPVFRKMRGRCSCPHFVPCKEQQPRSLRDERDMEDGTSRVVDFAYRAVRWRPHGVRAMGGWNGSG